MAPTPGGYELLMAVVKMCVCVGGGVILYCCGVDT